MYRQTKHDNAVHLLQQQLSIYFKRNPIAITRQSPFSMRLGAQLYGPDLQVILNSNPHFTPLGMTGPADIVVEVVSDRSAQRDHGRKIELYEVHPIQEYWIVDVRRHEVRFFQKSSEGVFIAHYPDYAHRYRTPLLPGFGLYVPMLWDLSRFSRQTAELNSDSVPQKSRSIASRR